MRLRRPPYGSGYPQGYGYPQPGNYGYRRGYGGGGNSCLRDACLIESGCCVAEALDGNCLMTSMLLLPALAGAALRGMRAETGGTPAGAAGTRAGAGGGVIGAVRFYQRNISSRRPAVCRFSPSCSEYTAQAVERHGALRGLRLGAARLLRCRPGGARGLDPVPAAA
ncbi:membrane protein insertion efficiency factor YidD [Plantactinospora siamensis]|uniref:Putative membrane protein insertion efficiency factor n=1 Tax=Plantactinospora siamensis TaxID=555372 RepID=A0ABV6P6E0_9ACTN